LKPRKLLGNKSGIAFVLLPRSDGGTVPGTGVSALFRAQGDERLDTRTPISCLRWPSAAMVFCRGATTAPLLGPLVVSEASSPGSSKSR